MKNFRGIFFAELITSRNDRDRLAFCPLYESHKIYSKNREIEENRCGKFGLVSINTNLYMF